MELQPGEIKVTGVSAAPFLYHGMKLHSNERDIGAWSLEQLLMLTESLQNGGIHIDVASKVLCDRNN
ncbi:hypothetical protein AAFF_G00178600 [Aldrovandia affinis]|uniref:Uncharacterized protein n=1 Tax=Aldrovandia affinis TaxID=143900 RepID=A0AAD7RKB7_9TELE|nr:hypothetical protein AAFF_G00178600 [Aldrovandia affinis]